MTRKEQEVRGRSYMPSSRAPSPGSLGGVEIAGVVQEHAEVERGVGVTPLLGALVGCRRAVDVCALMEHDPEVESAAGVAVRVESPEFPLFGLGRGTGRNGRAIPRRFRTSRGVAGGKTRDRGGTSGVRQRRLARGIRGRGLRLFAGASGTRRRPRRQRATPVRRSRSGAPPTRHRTRRGQSACPVSAPVRAPRLHGPVAKIGLAHSSRSSRSNRFVRCSTTAEDPGGTDSPAAEGPWRSPSSRRRQPAPRFRRSLH